MAPYGCLLGYKLISEEMKDEDIVLLIKRLGYAEGLPVVENPGILSPEAFIDEVVNERLPNPFMPDMPQRIVVDHSQKVSIRFGETIKSYIAKGLNLNELTALPIAIAGWLRYLLAVDDSGCEMEISPDPLKEELTKKLAGIVWNKPETHTGQIMEILKNPVIFGLNLTETPLAAKIEEIFTDELKGTGAVRETLKKYLPRN
jgi:fructuronate reductase